MGFKRTTEGRVFFQGANDRPDNDKSFAPPPSQQQAPSGPFTAQTQIQILSLLKALNEKLKSTQTERNQMRQEMQAYRALVEDLEGKAERSEKIYSELEQKFVRKEKSAEDRAMKAEQLAQEVMKELEETRSLLLTIEDKAEQVDKGYSSLKVQVTHARQIGDEVARKQALLEKNQKEYSEIISKAQNYEGLLQRLEETEQRQEDLGGKIEEALNQQARLMRQIDKTVEDRARFMRKIERIEETVIQTRDALTARAMVLLTDQNVGGEESQGLFPAPKPAGPPTPARKRLDFAALIPNFSRWGMPVSAQTAGYAALVVAALLGGWLISQMQRPSLPDFNALKTQTSAPLPDESASADIEPEESQVAESASAPQEWTVEEDTAPFSGPAETASETPALSSSVASEKIYDGDDIGTLDLSDEKKLQELLESNPDALAAQLNAIEPGSPQPLKTADIAPPPVAETPVKSAPRDEPPVIVKEPVKMKPDSRLPDVVKQVEKQAFDGVPEAQHDLAAIYTAGQGGVKQDYSRAAYWFERAAEQGIANARYNLGVLYHQGLGVKTDLKKALHWYQQAADLGHPEAQYNLGIAYIEGIGVEYNAEKAARYFENAAGKGIMEAAYNLGLIYENGLLGRPMPDEALLWYKSAADKGSPEAKAALAQLAKNLGISLDDVNKAVDGMKKSQATSTLPKEAGRQPQKQSSAGDNTQAMIAQIQEYLMGVGLYPGPADGVASPLTEDAIRAYQSLNDLAVSGEASPNLLSHMLANPGVEDRDFPMDQGSRNR